ncbi:unnamed protein product [Pleuronectes platessa]|uniref:Uncharacterized protein n=1 Tax=Pleuronectes platessa TaxID=8262 RepID=A0A9N7TZT7_PLEPL|nr:unnamed protein product [Pleuronectes platessa]
MCLKYLTHFPVHTLKTLGSGQVGPGAGLTLDSTLTSRQLGFVVAAGKTESSGHRTTVLESDVTSTSYSSSFTIHTGDTAGAIPVFPSSKVLKWHFASASGGHLIRTKDPPAILVDIHAACLDEPTKTRKGPGSDFPSVSRVAESEPETQGLARTKQSQLAKSLRTPFNGGSGVGDEEGSMKLERLMKGFWLDGREEISRVEVVEGKRGVGCCGIENPHHLQYRDTTKSHG